MSPDTFTGWVTALKAGGPWALCAILGLALYARDRQLRVLYDRVIELVEADTAANVSLRSSMDGLRVAVEWLTRTPPKP